MKTGCILGLILLITSVHGPAQVIKSIEFDPAGRFEISGFTGNGGELMRFDTARPLLSLDIDEVNYSSNQGIPDNGGLQFIGRVVLTWRPSPDRSDAIVIGIRNTTSTDTIRISNIVPLQERNDHVFITGRGDERLSRTKLFLPGKAPVSVIVPDNAWELGYSSIQVSDSSGIYALARRINVENGTRRRFWTDLNPGGEVEYRMNFDMFKGSWRDGLTRCFQEKLLYDLESFDNTLFERNDLEWIKSAYVIHLIMAWDHHFYDSERKNFTIPEFLKRGKEWYGGDDVIGLWPTWPTLGLDERNQWDLYQDLPGGIDKLRELSLDLKEKGTKLFISYNPWDQSTRQEDHLSGMADLIRDIDADGVILDTRGSSSSELQAAADGVKDGVVMFSEGMAIPKDMPGIISGRVHNALYYPPILNLNKLIKPDFAIFRVAELTYERVRREYALAFFNGYGTEINMFKPGQPDWIQEDYMFLGRTTRILRENHKNFVSYDWEPLINTLEDSIYVNKWPGEKKDIYTIFSLWPQGFKGKLFEVHPREGTHFVDLWNHEESEVIREGDSNFISVDLASFDRKYLGTNNEGSIGCVAELHSYLVVKQKEDKLFIQSSSPGEIKIWKGDPAYSKTPEEFDKRSGIFNTGRFEGKIVIQLFESNYLLDERVVHLPPGKPKLISKVKRTRGYNKAPKGMAEIPAGTFRPEFKDGDTFIYYPIYEGEQEVELDKFFMDVFPVTNSMYHDFLRKSGYVPHDTTNFLKHWNGGEVPEGLEDHPVIYVSIKDAEAYATWKEMRLPTEIEWQYAAQTQQHLKWPWGNEFDSLKCNTGTGIMDPVGEYTNGSNPYGLQDLVGNVWQLTNDTYESGSYCYTILKGGSYFKPTSSWWYVKGGPQELQHRQILLHVSEGFDRNSTVGFRCVADVRK